MSNFAFIILSIGLAYALYWYVSKKWNKRQDELNDFVYEMQRDFSDTTVTLNKTVDYFEAVKKIYEKENYSVSKSPMFPNDFIAKKDKDILFIRVQGLNENSDITAKSFQNFVGQTVLYALSNPLYESYNLKWSYVCSKMMCDQSARIFIKSYEDRLKFELIEI